MKPLPASPERIFVRCPNWLGDLVMSTPGLRALRQAYPGAHIVAHVVEPLVPLLAGHPDVDEVWPLRSRGRGVRALRAEAQRIAEGRFELGIVIPESISSALLMRWGAVGCVVGHSRDPLRRLLLHRVASRPTVGGRRLVARERFVLALMAAVGAGSDDATLELSVTPDEQARLARAVAESPAAGGVRDGSPLDGCVVLAPGASFGESKCWPVDSFAALGDLLAARGERVVLVGSEAERERVRSVAAAMRSECLVLAGALDVGALKALLRKACVLIANDAGARHVAVALGTPAVVFFGPTAVEKTDENLARVEVLETEHGCRPCYRRRCPIDHQCLATIGAGEALAAVERALARPRAGGWPSVGVVGR
jgi:heptosyltransferase-2